MSFEEIFEKNIFPDVKILAVDDDPFIQRILSSLFNDRYNFHVVPTLEEFRIEFKRFNPNIVLIDVVLKDGNGIDMCREIRADSANDKVSIIMLTAHDDVKSIEKAYRSGATDYIRKPFVPFEVSSKVANMSKSVIYEKSLLNLYKSQRDFNKRLYNLANLINKNANISTKGELIASILRVGEFMECDYFEVVLVNERGDISVSKDVSNPDFYPVEYARLKSEISKYDFRQKKCVEFRIKSKRRNINCMVIPIIINDKREGYIITESLKPFTIETKDMLSLYQDFVNIIGMDINYKDMMKEEISKDRSDLARVRSIQVALLPNFDNIPRFDIASTFIPLDEISGDFFDGFYISDDIYQVILCDVSGHGVASSYVGSSIRGIMRSASKERMSLLDMMNYLNNQIVLSLPKIYYFATIVVCRLNIKTGETELVSAGHPSSFYYDVKENRFDEITSTGPLLGLIPNGIFTNRVFNMKMGDALFLYTDGMTEAANENHEMYGEKRLMKCFAENISRPSLDIVHSLLGNIYEFTSYQSLQDDVTAICIKRVD